MPVYGAYNSIPIQIKRPQIPSQAVEESPQPVLMTIQSDSKGETQETASANKIVGNQQHLIKYVKKDKAIRTAA